MKNIIVEKMTIFSILKKDFHFLGNISQGKLDPVKNIKNQSISLWFDQSILSWPKMKFFALTFHWKALKILFSSIQI